MVGDVVRGPWKPAPARIDPAAVRWRRGRPLAEPRPHCAVCMRPFSPNAWIPANLVCADCREEQAREAERLAAEAPPGLFDDDQEVPPD